MHKSIDLFAGIGGIRRGFDNAFKDDIETTFVSEWDEPAQRTYKLNYPGAEIAGDITQIDEKDIPELIYVLQVFHARHSLWLENMAGSKMIIKDVVEELYSKM